MGIFKNNFYMVILLVLLWIMYGIMPRVITFFNLDNSLTKLFTKLFLYLIIITTLFVIIVLLLTFGAEIYDTIKGKNKTKTNNQRRQ